MNAWRGLKQHITVMMQDGNLVKFVGFKEVGRIHVCVCEGGGMCVCVLTYQRSRRRCVKGGTGGRLGFMLLFSIYGQIQSCI